MYIVIYETYIVLYIYIYIYTHTYKTLKWLRKKACVFDHTYIER
jgi:hypothetical protein